MDDPEPDTIAAAVDGDRDALTRVLESVQPHVWRFITTLERDPATVEDLTQEVLLRVARGLPRFRGDSRLRTWVFTIARNIVRDHQRAVRRRPRLVAAELAPEASTEEPDPALGIDLRTAVGRLDPALREVFVLVEVVGMPYREAARILEIPEGTVKSRMFHARRELIRLLSAGEAVDDVR